jgi:hypothetical protein
VIDTCRSCKYPETDRICIFNELKYQDLCPCIECLVKMMCITQPNCDERCRTLKALVDGITKGQPRSHSLLERLVKHERKRKL